MKEEKLGRACSNPVSEMQESKATVGPFECTQDALDKMPFECIQTNKGGTTLLKYY